MKRLTMIVVLAMATIAQAQLATLNAPDASAGASVLLVSKGVAMGAPQANGGQGAVYLYAIPKNGWNGQQQPSATLTATDGQLGDGFGSAMVTAGSQLIVAAPGAFAGDGALYVYVNLKLTQELTWAGGCGLGAALSTSLSNPQWLLAAAPGCIGGVAMLYQFDGQQWQFVNQVDPPNHRGTLDTVAIGYGSGDQFGNPIFAMGTPAAGVPGMVYLSNNQAAFAGQAEDFGSTISMQQSSNLLFVGEPSTGTVYVYYGPMHNGWPYWAAGKLVGKLTDSQLGPGSGFGSAISARGKALLIAAPGVGTVDMFLQPTRQWASSDAPARRYAVAGSSLAWEVGKLPQFILGDPGSGVGYVEAAQ